MIAEYINRPTGPVNGFLPDPAARLTPFNAVAYALAVAVRGGQTMPQRSGQSDR